MANVIDPCFLQGIRNKGLDEMMGGAGEALDLVKILQASNIENMVNAITPFLGGQSAATRETLYSVFLMQCLSGMAEGQQ